MQAAGRQRPRPPARPASPALRPERRLLRARLFRKDPPTEITHSALIIPVSQRRKLRPSAGKWRVQGHTAAKRQSRDVRLDSSVPEPTHLKLPLGGCCVSQATPRTRTGPRARPWGGDRMLRSGPESGGGHHRTVTFPQALKEGGGMDRGRGASSRRGQRGGPPRKRARAASVLDQGWDMPGRTRFSSRPPLAGHQ